MKKLLFILLIISMPTVAQEMIFFNNDSINRLDPSNNKTGFWKIYDLKRNIVASGPVKNNEKFEEVNYFIDGKIFATQKQDSIIIFYKNSDRIRTKFSRKNRATSIVKENGEPIDDETKTKYFKSAELPVMFYGGSLSIAQYIANNVDPRLKGIRGRVVIEAVIDIDGKIEQPRLVSSENPALNTEALKLVKNMPRWQPGFQQGHFVRSIMRIPISF